MLSMRERPASALHRSGWWTEVAIAGLFLAFGMIVIVAPIASGTKVPGDLVDGRLNLALLEYLWRCVDNVLHGRFADFLNAPFFYPWPRVTNFTDTYWGQGAPYLLARALGFAPYTALQTWFDTGFVLNYISAYWCLRKFGVGRLGSAAGAFLFSFALPVMHQSGHPNLLYRIWVPPALLAADRFLKQGNLAAGAAALLFVALQLSINIYTGLFLVILLVSYGLALASIRQVHLPGLRGPSAAEIRISLLLALAAIAILLLVIIPYHNVARSYHFARSWPNVEEGLPHLQSYILADRSLWPDFSNLFPLPLTGEQKIFPGLAALIPLSWFLCSRRARARYTLALPMLITAALVTAFTIDIGGVTFFRLLYHLPGFSVLRVVARIILVSLFPLAVLLGLLIDDWTRKGQGRALSIAAAALVALLVLEPAAVGYSGMDKALWRARDAALLARLPKNLPQDAILAIAAPQPTQDYASLYDWNAVQMDAQLFAIMHGLRTVNGTSGNAPGLWRGPTSCADVGGDIKAGLLFSAIHGLTPPVVKPEQLLLVGFGACDKAAVLRQPVLQFGHAYQFSGSDDGDALIGNGFTEPQDGARWTDGRDAYLYFSLARPMDGPAAVWVKARALSPNPDNAQKVDVYVNGIGCGSLLFTTDPGTSDVVCPAYSFRAGGNALHFDVTQPVPPPGRSEGAGQPTLGMDIKALTVFPVGRQ